jgi:hypothetical protein
MHIGVLIGTLVCGVGPNTGPVRVTAAGHKAIPCHTFVHVRHAVSLYNLPPPGTVWYAILST